MSHIAALTTYASMSPPIATYREAMDNCTLRGHRASLYIIMWCSLVTLNRGLLKKEQVLFSYPSHRGPLYDFLQKWSQFSVV